MNTDLSEFMANLAHELRNPLNGILGFTELLLEEKPGPLNPRQKEYLRDVLESGRHLLRLMNDVADLSKIDAGHMPLRVETFSLRAVIAEAAEGVAPVAAAKGIVLRQLVAPGLDMVTLDRGKLIQSLGNLISGAVKVTSCGEVCVRAAVTGQARVPTFTLQVSDRGLDSQSRGKLFVEFRELESAGVQHVGATGLTLALTRKLLELQQGHMNVESRDGLGSVVTVQLPVAIG